MHLEAFTTKFSLSDIKLIVNITVVMNSTKLAVGQINSYSENSSNNNNNKTAQCTIKQQRHFNSLLWPYLPVSIASQCYNWMIDGPVNGIGIFITGIISNRCNFPLSNDALLIVRFTGALRRKETLSLQFFSHYFLF